MGAWGHDIMASDTSLDHLWVIKKICGDTDADLTKELLNTHMDEIVKHKPYSYEEDSFVQVLAYQIVTLGARMPAFIINRIESAVDEDTSMWDEPEERSKYLTQLHKAVYTYQDGIPHALKADIGLFATIAEGLKETN
jgi:hypothetical protein